MKTVSTTFYCDRCGDPMGENDGPAGVIVDAAREYGSRFNVVIQKYGAGDTAMADLCRDCAVMLLRQAAGLIEKGAGPGIALVPA